MANISDYRVIALSDSPRITGFMQQPLGGRFRVSDAIDARSGGHREQFDVDGFRRHFGRSPLNGEIGCTLSHLGVMQEFAVDQGGPTDWLVIAEDDARLSPHASVVLNALAEKESARSRIIVLAGGTGLMDQPNRHPRSQSENQLQLSLLARRVARGRGRPVYKVGRWSRGLVGAALYMVNRKAAQDITDYVRGECAGRPWWLADYHGMYRDRLGVDVQALRPIIARWDDHGSTIEVDGLDSWRDTAEGSGSASPREHANALVRRSMLRAKSTKFDVIWRLRRSQEIYR